MQNRSEDNPYDAPASLDDATFVRRSDLMTAGKALATVATTAVVCGLGGLGVGLLIGTVFPDFYRATIPAARQPGFNIPAVGAGLGLIQGLAVGLVVGVFIVAILCWYRSRMIRLITPHETTTRSSVSSRQQ